MNGHSYTITEYWNFGLTINGELPVDMMPALVARAARLVGASKKKIGAHTQLTRRLQASMVFTSDGAAEKWLEELNKLPVKRVTGLKWLDQWIDRGEVGLSSATIAVHCFGERFGLTMRSLGMASRDSKLPLDADDFGRCQKLVQLAADNGAYLTPQLATAPGWAPIVARWADLCAADYDTCTAMLEKLRQR